MIEAAIEKIARMTRDAKRVELAPDHRVNGKYFIFDHDGDYDVAFAQDAPPSTRHFSTESLARRVKADLAHHNVTSVDGYWNDHLLNVDLMTGVIEGDDDSYELKWSHDLLLVRHPAFSSVASLTTTRSYNQKALIKFLRADLNGHVDDAVVEQFRNLKLSTEGGTDSVVAKGREAIDKRIQQQIRQAAGADIPDEITVTIPVLDLDEVRDELYKVTILVDTTVDDNGGVQFELTTVLNTLRAAERAALDSIVANLTAALPDTVPLYHAAVK